MTYSKEQYMKNNPKNKTARNSTGFHKPVVCVLEDGDNLPVTTSLSQIQCYLEPTQAKMVGGAAGYRSDALHMAVVTCIVQGEPGIAVTDRGVGICTGELRMGGKER